MKLTEKQKLIIAVIAFLISGYIIYSSFFKSGAQVPQNASVVGEGGVVTVDQNQDIIDLANKFNEISINIDLFSSPFFKTLKDLEVPLSPEDAGRPNPFLNIGTDSSSSIVNTPQSSTSTSIKKP